MEELKAYTVNEGKGNGNKVQATQKQKLTHAYEQNAGLVLMWDLSVSNYIVF